MYCYGSTVWKHMKWLDHAVLERKSYLWNVSLIAYYAVFNRQFDKWRHLTTTEYFTFLFLMLTMLTKVIVISKFEWQRQKIWIWWLWSNDGIVQVCYYQFLFRQNERACSLRNLFGVSVSKYSTRWTLLCFNFFRYRLALKPRPSKTEKKQPSFYTNPRAPKSTAQNGTMTVVMTDIMETHENENYEEAEDEVQEVIWQEDLKGLCHGILYNFLWCTK